VITAVGMAQHLAIMVLANLIALGVMLGASDYIARFVEEHPSIKVLALSFLLLIGFSLVAEGFGKHIPKGYIYFAMGFSVFVEMLNIRAQRKHPPVALKGTAPVGLKTVMRVKAQG
jgi:predicted tellurium resistance membrane protein TerC